MFQLGNKFQQVDLSSLDDSQLRAVVSNSNNIVIRAAAGSGKTTTLIKAVANYRFENLNDRICAITYTRAARAEMEARFYELGIYDVEVTTIHVWARNLLNEFAHKYDFKVEILEEKEIKYILSEIVKDYLLKSRVKSVNLNILYNYITGSKTMDITENYRRTLNALEARYIKYKKDNGLYDFSDYPQYLWDVMETYDETIKGIDALFVDEFQDVDTIQFQIFEKVVGTKKKFFIGDPWQSIYIFRSADGEVFNKLSDFELVKLKYNYRSYQEIIDYASYVYESFLPLVMNDDNELYISMISDLPSESGIQCIRGYGGEVVVVNPWGRYICFKDGVTETLYDGSALLEEMLTSDKTMILCRTNKQVKALQEKGFINVSTVHQAKGLEYDQVIVVDTSISSYEDLNVAYVAMTRARDRLLIINWPQLESAA